MTKTAAPTVLYEEDHDILRFEEDDDFGPSHTAKAPINHHDHAAETEEGGYIDLKRKQEELLHLRHALQEKERETTHLEARKQKEEHVTSGRREMCERFSRTLVRLERELYNAQKAIEEITVARDQFDRHHNLLRALQPEAWQRANLDAELDHALGAIEDAEEEYGKTMRRLASMLDGQSTANGSGSTVGGAVLPGGFVDQLRFGFAFTLPLGIIVFAAIILAKILFHQP